MDVHIVNKILIEWDPLNLLECHIPDDEYFYEANIIFNRFNVIPHSPSDLAKIIYDTFVQSFGDDFTLGIEECQKIALSILK